MSSPEMQRLMQDMQRQPALRGTLGAELAGCADAAAASALLRQHGYAIGEAELAGGAALPDAALDQLAAGMKPWTYWLTH